MRWGRSRRDTGTGFQCSGCGQWHAEMSLAFHSPAPANWLQEPTIASDPNSELSSDQCVIGGNEFYVRGLVQVPVVDGRVFEWGVWVSLSRENFLRMSEVWSEPGRKSEPPMFGWLSTALPTYSPGTLNLKTMVHQREVGLRPLILVEPTDHPLAVEQQVGITVAALGDRVALLLHG